MLCAAPGEPLAAHHAGGRLAVGELGAALAVDSLEGVADARLAGLLGGHFRRGQVDRGAAHRAGLQHYTLKEESVMDGVLAALSLKCSTSCILKGWCT